MLIPPLPAHMPVVGKTTWDAAPYLTNAIATDDKPGNRRALTVEATGAEVLDYGSFMGMTLTWRKQAYGWLWRAGQDVALWHASNAAMGVLRKKYEAAVAEQKQIEKLHGRM